MSSPESTLRSPKWRDRNQEFEYEFEPRSESQQMQEQSESDRFGVFDIVDAVVPRHDNAKMPALTFRVLIIGAVSNIAFTTINTIFSFRTNSFEINPFMTILISYPLGVLMAATLPVTTFTIPRFFCPFSTSLNPPTFTLNPGPFTVKEHALIFIFASAASNPSYAMYNIISQKYILGQPIGWGWCLLFSFVCQFYGYGLSGLFRKFLVRPAAMLWPANLSVIAVINSFHSPKASDTQSPEESEVSKALSPQKFMSRHKFFWIAASIMFAWQWLPSFIAPILSAVSLICLIAPNANNRVKLFGSAAQGVGVASLTFDWTLISGIGPITSPLWALANNLFGRLIFMWMLVPILWSYDAFGSDNLLGTNPADGANGTGEFPLGYALNTFVLFANDNSPISTASLLDGSMQLNQTIYDLVKPVHITTLLAVNYASKFLSMTAAVSHMFLWYREEIYVRFTTAARDLDENDIHAQLMDIYPEVPDWWYICTLLANSLLALSVCQWGGFELQWWAVVLSTAFALTMFLPIGVTQAISGQSIAVNVVAELIAGYLLPGQLVGVLTFKTLTYMSIYQGLNLIQDLKLGHYMKLPPRDVFWTQMMASLLACFVNFVTATKVFETIGEKILNGLEGWNAASYQTFLMTGAVWGAIGPERFFGDGAPYQNLLYCFLAGVVLPVIPWLFHKLNFGDFWCLISIPLLVTMPDEIGILHSDLITPLIVAVIVNYFIKRFRHAWWSRFAYIMSAAFDTGAAIAVMVIFFVFKMTGISMPFYALNRIDFEICSPDFFMMCLEHIAEEMSDFGLSDTTVATQSTASLFASYAEISESQLMDSHDDSQLIEQLQAGSWVRNEVFQITQSNVFSTFILLVIIANTIMLALETVVSYNRAYCIFNTEIFRALRLFRAARAIRSLRALRTVNMLRSLHVIITIVFKSIPAMINIAVLMGITLYILAVVATSLYRDVDPRRFGSILTSLFRLFQLMTLDKWSNIVNENRSKSWTIEYFVVFVIVLETLFIAVIVNNLQTARARINRQRMLRTSRQIGQVGSVDSFENMLRTETPANGNISFAMSSDDIAAASAAAARSRQEQLAAEEMLGIDNYYPAGLPQRTKELLETYFMHLSALEYNMAAYDKQQKVLEELVDLGKDK
ncbi:hypothetical protein HDU82_004962 [Entophlyctis luteolus]|nr:hypothetical protein HDU82_004962 [Entophlyctis luteolus]